MGIEVSRPITPVSIQIFKEEGHPIKYPVRVSVVDILTCRMLLLTLLLEIILRHLDVAEDQADTEIVYAKFVIGADGKVNLCGC